MRRPTACPSFLFVLLAFPLGAQELKTYTVDAEASSVLVQVGKSGLLKLAGHEHEVSAPALRGEVITDGATHHSVVHKSSVSLTFDTPAMKVTGRGEPADDVPKVQEAMIGPKVLDAARFPTVTFKSLAVSGRETSPGQYQVNVAGELTLHGVSRRITITGRVEVAGDGLTITADLPLRQSDYGMTPVTAAAGTVRVKDEVIVKAKIVARAR